MNHTPARARCNIGDLVAVAFEKASQVTHDRMLIALIASRLLEDWLEKSNRQDLVKQLQATTS
jgi:hypothetical protein